MTSLDDLLDELRVTVLCRACRSRGYRVATGDVRLILRRTPDLDRAFSLLCSERTFIQRLLAPVIRPWPFLQRRSKPR